MHDRQFYRIQETLYKNDQEEYAASEEADLPQGNGFAIGAAMFVGMAAMAVGASYGVYKLYEAATGKDKALKENVQDISTAPAVSDASSTIHYNDAIEQHQRQYAQATYKLP